MSIEEVWALGDVVGSGRDRPAKALGDFLESDVLAAGLSLINAEPPERHYHILGWDNENKAKQKLQAQLLAPKLELHIRE